MQELDLDADFLLDLVKRRKFYKTQQRLGGLKKDVVKGYIQDISLYPFVVTLFTQKQMEILRDLLKFNKNCVLHIDCTGGMAANLPELYKRKRMFYYAVTVSLSQSTGATVIPIYEFFTNKQSTRSLGIAMNGFFEKFIYNFTQTVTQLYSYSNPVRYT